MGDSNDDYYKADYILKLVDYLNNKRTSVISINNEDQLEEVICIVNNIFDHAYFLKLDHPEKSDLECFTEAERTFCEEKWLDYEAYLEYLNRVQYGYPGNAIIDYETAKERLRKQRIEEKAQRISVDKMANHLPSDPLADYYEAEKVVFDESLHAKISEIIWYKYPMHQMPKEFYWQLADKVMSILAKENYQADLSVNQDIYVKGIIEQVVNEQLHTT
jgi:hypothetical protein